MKKISKQVIACFIICSVVSISISIPIYFSGKRKGYQLAYDELQKPVFENWIYLQKENQSMYITPCLGFGLNLSENVENKLINTTIIDTILETVYVLNITATTGNLTAFGFAVIFNDAFSLHYWTRTTRYYDLYYNITPNIGRTVYKSNYREGIHYPTSYINFRGFETARIIRLEIFISNIVY